MKSLFLCLFTTCLWVLSAGELRCDVTQALSGNAVGKCLASISFHRGGSKKMRATYVSVCYRDDPQVDECLKNTITKLLPILKSGSADFDLDPLDPMTMENLVYNYRSPVIGGSFQITSAVINGLSRMEVSDVRTNLKNPKKFIMEFDAHLPNMNIKAGYTMSGNVIRIPVKMNGNVDIDFDDLDLKYRIEGDVKKIGQFDYLILNSFTWRFRGQGMRNLILRNDDVVHDRPALNRVVTTIVRTAWRQLKDYMLPALLPEADRLLKSMFTNFFKKYPYDTLFPKRGKDEDDDVDYLRVVEDEEV